MIDPQEILEELGSPLTRELLEPLILTHATGVHLEEAGTVLDHQLSGMTWHQLREVAGAALIFASSQAVYAAHVTDLVRSLDPKAT